MYNDENSSNKPLLIDPNYLGSLHEFFLQVGSSKTKGLYKLRSHMLVLKVFTEYFLGPSFLFYDPPPEELTPFLWGIYESDMAELF